jgi:hypothetical protein
MTPATHRRWFRFGLRTLFVLVTMVGVLIWGARGFLDWYYSTPLADAIARFNTLAAKDMVGKLESPLTETEAISSIKSQLGTPDMDQEVKEVFSRIVRTQRLPQGCGLSWITDWSPDGGRIFTVWWVDLDVITRNGTRYRMRLRATNKPIFAQATGRGAPE